MPGEQMAEYWNMAERGAAVVSLCSIEEQTKSVEAKSNAQHLVRWNFRNSKFRRLGTEGDYE
jgi:hypothetical protein